MYVSVCIINIINYVYNLIFFVNYYLMKIGKLKINVNKLK